MAIRDTMPGTRSIVPLYRSQMIVDTRSGEHFDD
jgi:hypothetical protein